jgi:hypothetical protein
MKVILRDFPSIVIGLISGQYQIPFNSIISPDGVTNIQVSVPRFYIFRYSMYYSDFLICQQVAEQFAQEKHGPGPIDAFKSEPISDLKARIAAVLQVQFAGR